MIPRFKPWLSWSEILSLFKSNKGAVECFEKAFAKKFNAVDAIAFPYGRSAQWAFFKAMGIQNAEIIMPAYTCSVVAHAVSLSGNTPQFIDINLDDYNMNLDEAEAAINENTRNHCNAYIRLPARSRPARGNGQMCRKNMVTRFG